MELGDESLAKYAECKRKKNPELEELKLRPQMGNRRKVRWRVAPPALRR